MEQECVCGSAFGPVCGDCLRRLAPGLVHLLGVSVGVPAVYETAVRCSRMWLLEPRVFLESA